MSNDTIRSGDWQTRMQDCIVLVDPIIVATLPFATVNPAGVQQAARDKYVKELVSAVRESLQSNPTIARYRSLRQQVAEADKAERAARARLTEAQARRQALEIEAGPGLAKALATADKEIAGHQAAADEAARDRANLAPLLADAKRAAQQAIDFPLRAAAAKKANTLMTDARRDTLDRLLEVAAPFLQELGERTAAAHVLATRGGSLLSLDELAA